MSEENREELLIGHSYTGANQRYKLTTINVSSLWSDVMPMKDRTVVFDSNVFPFKHGDVGKYDSQTNKWVTVEPYTTNVYEIARVLGVADNSLLLYGLKIGEQDVPLTCCQEVKWSKFDIHRGDYLVLMLKSNVNAVSRIMCNISQQMLKREYLDRMR